jgi:precorrin-3B methylase
MAYDMATPIMSLTLIVEARSPHPVRQIQPSFRRAEPAEFVVIVARGDCKIYGVNRVFEGSTGGSSGFVSPLSFATKIIAML